MKAAETVNKKDSKKLTPALDKNKADALSFKGAAESKLSVEQQLEMYSKMLRIRRFEENAFQSYQRGQIGGFCHLYIGQEAVAVGALAALVDGDKVLTAYRDHGHALALGMPANSLMAELFGKIDGSSKGKGGSMHFFDAQRGMLGGNGIVGSHVPVAAGVAFAQKYKGEKNVTLVFFGDGAAQQGAVHEAMNLAGLWRLPVVFIVENNKYGMGTAVERSSAVLELHQRASAYNFSGIPCDGMDVIDVYDKVSAAVSMARNLNTPTFIEAKTYRYRGHSMSDPAAYRTAEEVEQYKHNDPILMLKSDLIKRGVKENQLQKIDDEAKAEAKASVDFAAQSPQPPTEELWKDIYANPWDNSLLPKTQA